MNIFDTLPSLVAGSLVETRNELDIYLGSDPESIVDGLEWWNKRRDRFPRLSRMALDYLSIPGMYQKYSILRYNL